MVEKIIFLLLSPQKFTHVGFPIDLVFRGDHWYNVCRLRKMSKPIFVVWVFVQFVECLLYQPGFCLILGLAWKEWTKALQENWTMTRGDLLSYKFPPVLTWLKLSVDIITIYCLTLKITFYNQVWTGDDLCFGTSPLVEACLCYNRHWLSTVLDVAGEGKNPRLDIKLMRLVSANWRRRIKISVRIRTSNNDDLDFNDLIESTI